MTLAPGNYVIAAEAGSGTREPFGGSASVTYASGISYVNGWFGGSNFSGTGTNITFSNASGGNASNNTWISGVFRVAAITGMPSTGDANPGLDSLMLISLAASMALMLLGSRLHRRRAHRASTTIHMNGL